MDRSEHVLRTFIKHDWKFIMWVLICLFLVEIAHECKQININMNLVFKIVNNNCDVLTTL